MDRGLILAAQSVKHGGIARTVSEIFLAIRIGFRFESLDRKRLFKLYLVQSF